MKLFRKLYRSHTIVLITVLMYFLLFHAGLTTCCPCGFGDSQVSNGDKDPQNCTYCADTQKLNMNFPAMALMSSTNHSHDCSCNEITFSNYILEDYKSSFQSMKPVRYHFSPASSGDTILKTTGILSCIQHLLPPLIMERNATLTIRTVVLLV